VIKKTVLVWVMGKSWEVASRVLGFDICYCLCHFSIYTVKVVAAHKSPENLSICRTQNNIKLEDMENPIVLSSFTFMIFTKIGTFVKTSSH
jgi:hypothetical protein